MTDSPPAKHPARIDAAELLDIRLSHDGRRLALVVRDAGGSDLRLSLPVNCLNAVLASIPREVERGPIHNLDTWSIAQAADSGDLVLTLCTAEGREVSFTTKPWQIQGMATIAMYGRAPATGSRHRH